MSEARDWYRHKRTGDRAYRETVDGVDSIILDRPNEPIIKPFREGEWITDKDARPLNEMGLAQVAFSADAVLCKQLGHHNKENLWINLRDGQRIAWMKKGPQKSFPRRTLYEHLMWAVQYLASADHPPPSVHVLKEMLRVVREEAEKPGRKSKAMKELIHLLEGDDSAEEDAAAAE